MNPFKKKIAIISNIQNGTKIFSPLITPSDLITMTMKTKLSRFVPASLLRLSSRFLSFPLGRSSCRSCTMWVVKPVTSAIYSWHKTIPRDRSFSLSSSSVVTKKMNRNCRVSFLEVSHWKEVSLSRYFNQSVVLNLGIKVLQNASMNCLEAASLSNLFIFLFGCEVTFIFLGHLEHDFEI